MKLQNLHAKGRTLYTFERLDSGELSVKEIKDFHPYYFELDPAGTHETYDGKLAKKVYANNPYDIAKNRSATSYESDIHYTKRYMIDCVSVVEKSPTKYLFFDIEILTPELPDTTEAKYPISCITVYSNYTQDYTTWYIEEWAMDEAGMLDDFIHYIASEKPDFICAWNIDFDYTYLYNRHKKLFKKSEYNFAEAISPMLDCRSGKSGCQFPAGLSVVDYMGMYEKLTLGKKRSYALDYIAQTELGEAPWGETDFGVLNTHVKAKNINDVKRMVLIEERSKVIPNFDEIRRFSKTFWEDLPAERKMIDGKLQGISNNSKIIDMIVLQEAHDSGVVLSKKPDGQDKAEFEGAYRETYETGAFFNIGKYDLSGAYLYAIIDLCLDTSNIVTEAEYKADKSILAIGVTDRKTQQVIHTHFVRQNKKALLPVVVEKLVNEKNIYKDLLKATGQNEPEYDDLEQKYKAVKTIVLSSWGVIANQYFRLYDSRIASMITSSVRDLLRYVKEETEKLGYPVIYVDTDSVFCKDNGVNIADKLNQLIQNWAKARFGIKSSITFEHEGHFEKILILTKCHYYGYVKGKTKPEIKGVEVKRSGSSKFEANFQEQLINKVLNKESKESIVEWIKTEESRIKEVPVQQIAFPSKITSDKYVNEPIFVRACNNSKSLFKGFNVERGNLFYYIFVEPLGTDLNNKDRNVIAFTQEYDVFERSKTPININWDEMIRRNIHSKVEGIFDVMGWGTAKEALSGQTILF